MLLLNPGSCYVRATSLHYLDIVRRWLVEMTRKPWRQGEAHGDLNERDRLSFCEGLELADRLCSWPNGKMLCWIMCQWA